MLRGDRNKTWSLAWTSSTISEASRFPSAALARAVGSIYNFQNRKFSPATALAASITVFVATSPLTDPLIIPVEKNGIVLNS